MNRRAFAAALALTLGLTPGAATAQAPGQAVPRSDLTRLLAAQLSRFPSKSGVYVKDLATGPEAFVRGDEHFESASTIKIAILVLAFQLADAGKLDLTKRHVLGPDDFRGGSGILRYADFGLAPTLHDLITQMVVTSDNTATDIMIRHVGGVDAVNAFLQRSGFASLRLNKTLLDHFRWRYEVLDPKYRSLSAQDVFALQSNAPYFAGPRQALIRQVQDETAARDLDSLVARAGGSEDTWLGVVTPRELGRILEGIERETIASPSACQDMKRILRAQQSGARKIPHFLTVPVAHKTGENTGVTHDMGMIYARSGTIVMISLNTGVTGLMADADDRIGGLARLVVDYFDGAR